MRPDQQQPVVWSAHVPWWRRSVSTRYALIALTVSVVLCFAAVGTVIIRRPDSGVHTAPSTDGGSDTGPSHGGPQPAEDPDAKNRADDDKHDRTDARDGSSESAHEKALPRVDSPEVPGDGDGSPPGNSGSGGSSGGGFIWPSASNTGIAGCPALTTHHGDLRPGNGETYENLLVTGGQILINFSGAHDITLRCIKVVDYEWYFPIDVERQGATSASMILFDHVEVDCGGSQVAHAGFLLFGATVRNSRVYNCADGYRFGSNVIIENSLCHNLHVNGDDDNSWHYDCSQSTGGNNVVIRNNVFIGRDTSDILIKSDLEPIDNVLVENNKFLGTPGYMVYSVAGNYGVPTNVRFIGNRFGRDFIWGPCTFQVPAPVWTNNVWDDTGAAIPLNCVE